MAAKILSLKTWTPCTYEVRNGDEVEGVIGYEVKRLRQDEAVEFAAATVRAFGVLDRAREALGPEGTLPDDATDAQKSHAMLLMSEATRDFFRELTPELITNAFEHMIRNVSGVELDGEPITTGARLREVADDRFVVAAIVNIRAASNLTAAEGKASGSPSTSGSTPLPNGSDSAAPSTVKEGGPTSSTATPTPSAPESCSESEIQRAASPA